uniref:NADH dehydrogenase subunit 4L n=1 Tax=Thienemanniella majuscula TaxID=611686 RepID=UPI0028D847FF|nr:NADH dehydrogenase subunit 4L [Thienemanniella majuscula]WML69326.1 NADH dehydrogenase subunit 4L [Thienemanniella majuscula]
MMMIFVGFSSVLVFSGIISFISSRKHLLSSLLSLEFIVLSIFFFFFFFLNFFNFELYFTMFFLTFSVCEGALGLAILVSLIRTHGNDYFNSFSILQC